LADATETTFQLTPVSGAACGAAAITPPDQDFVHTYYDVCPWSPSGRYLAALRVPFADRRSGPDDAADLCLFDLARRTMRTLWRTTAWGIQTGAHAQWGGSDRYVYFNDRRDGKPVGVRLDVQTAQARWYDGPVWLVDPSESFALSPCLVRANLTQFGYGVSVSADAQRTNRQMAADDDGFYRTDLATGRCKLLVSLAAVRAAMGEADLEGATLYAFHCKLNPQANRLLLVVRAWYPHRRYRPMLLTCRPDGGGLRCVLSPQRWQGGAGSGHPTWTPDGGSILMNHAGGRDQHRFCLIDPDSGQARPLVDEPPGTGHPTLSQDGRWLLTDDHATRGDRRPGTLRLVDLAGGGWRDLLTVDNPLCEDDSLRCDAHPAWDRSCRLVCLQGTPVRGRQLFIVEPARPAGELPALS